jgi:hypothetical protein
VVADEIVKVEAPAPQESHADEVVGEGELVEGDRRERRVRRVRRVRGERDDTHSRDRWCRKCHRGDLDFIEIGVVTIGVETLGGALSSDDLKRKHFVAEGQRRWNWITADAGTRSPGGPTSTSRRKAEMRARTTRPRPGGRIPDDEPGTQLRRVVACAVGIVRTIRWRARRVSSFPAASTAANRVSMVRATTSLTVPQIES